MNFIKYTGNNEEEIISALEKVTGDIYVHQGGRCNNALVIKYLNVSADLEVGSYLLVFEDQFAIVPDKIGNNIESTYNHYDDLRYRGY